MSRCVDGSSIGDGNEISEQKKTKFSVSSADNLEYFFYPATLHSLSLNDRAEACSTKEQSSETEHSTSASSMFASADSSTPGIVLRNTLSPADAEDKPGSNSESAEILSKTRNILRELSSAISKSLDAIPQSIALPSVAKAYKEKSREMLDASELGSSVKSSASEPSPRPVADVVPPIPGDVHVQSSQEVSIQMLAALECRCLEYREMLQDIANAALEELQGGLSLVRWSKLVQQFKNLRCDFWNFRELCAKTALSNRKTQPLPDSVTELIQASFLKHLQEENETFIVRLAFGLEMGKVGVAVMRLEEKTSKRIEKLEMEILHLKSVYCGFSV